MTELVEAELEESAVAMTAQIQTELVKATVLCLNILMFIGFG